MDELPTSFGKYFLTEKLATGGMAEIYLAKLIGPNGFEKQLVIKLIHPALSGQQAFVAMFVAEAKILVGLSHGNIVPIYELGVLDGTYYIAMEYIDGPTLDQLTRALAASGQAMAPAAAAHIAGEIFKGLDYAHRKGEGVIHRDLSPRNVMLARDGEVKLVDFGIAVPQGHERDPSQRGPEGSFPYMSPEQVRGDTLTGQSDLFSAGVLLWELLTGARLFARESPEETLDAVLSAPIAPPSSIRAEVPAALDAICARALARDRGQRYPRAAACLRDLNRYLYSLDEPVAAHTLAALVAARCPPERRPRAASATAADSAARPGGKPAGGGAGPATVPLPRPGSSPTSAAPATTPLPRPNASPAGDNAAPATAPLPPRSAAAEAAPPGTAPLPPTVRTAPATASGDEPATQPRGKRRAATAQSFATHVEIERVLSGTAEATPPYPGPALAQARSGPHQHQATEPSREAVGGASAPPRRRRGPVAVLVAVSIALAATALVVIGPLRDRAPDTPNSDTPNGDLTRTDAADGAAPRAAAAIRTPAPGERSGADPQAAATPAASSTTAVEQPPAATAPAPRPTAPAAAQPRAAQSERKSPQAPTGNAPAPRPQTRDTDARAGATAATPATTGVGKLKVGANPWGEVYVDGERLGRAPNAWSVPAGPHVVEVVFPIGEVKPRRRFDITVASGATVSVGIVDFRAAAAAAAAAE